MAKKIDKKDLYRSVLVLIVIVSVIIYMDEQRSIKVSSDLKKPGFIFLLLTVIFISAWGLTNKDKRIQSAVRNGIVALLTAYFAHIDMIFATFFLVAIFVYYTDTND